MAENVTREDTLRTYVSDMHALVEHGIQALDRQVDNLSGEGHEETRQAIEGFRRMLETQRVELDRRVEAIGGTARKSVKDAVTNVAGEIAGWINAVRTEEAAKSIRDDYTYLSLVAVSYLMLHTTAAGLGDHETAELAERFYRETAGMIVVIDRIIPNVVIEELRQDGLAIEDVSGACREMVQRSWESQTSLVGLAR